MNEHALEVLEYAKVIELLAGHASSGLGQRLAYQLQPLTDAPLIQQLIEETSELKQVLCPDLTLPLGGLHDLFPLFDRLDQGADLLNPPELMLIKETLRANRNLRAYFCDVNPEYGHLRRWGQSLGDYPEIEARLQKALGDTGTIQTGASSELKSIRSQMRTLRGRIRGKMQTIMRASNVSPYLQDAVVHERKGRPVIALKRSHASRVSGARRDLSDSGQTVFVEPEGIRQMGDELEEAINAEKAEIVRILQEIAGLIASKLKPLRTTLLLLAHIDLTYAKVRFSRSYDMNAPLLDDSNSMVIRNARHPLLLALQREETDSASDTDVVPLDFRIGSDFNTLVITGPNTGGKTVTLKTVGLLSLMAQSGLHIPAAEGSRLPVFTQIFADIGDEQSIEQSLSTFSSHLQNIGRILASVDGHSLVLLDELGGGTDPAEGAALARSILEYLHNHQARTVVTTHISDLKNLGYTIPGFENASVEFDVQTLRPTYRLLTGTPGSSNALAVARRLGLPAQVLADAKMHTEHLDDGLGDLLNELQSAKVTIEENRHTTDLARTEAERLEREYRQKLDEVTQREAELGETLRKEAFSALRDLKRQVDLLARADSSQDLLARGLARMSELLDKHLYVHPEEQEQRKATKEIEAGDEVYVRTFGQTGTLRRIDQQRKKAVVQLGPIQMTVSLKDVEAVPV